MVVFALVLLLLMLVEAEPAPQGQILSCTVLRSQWDGPATAEDLLPLFLHALD